MNEEPYHPSSTVEFVLLIVKLVFVVKLVLLVILVSVVKLVFAETLFDEALELLRVVIGVEVRVLVVVSLASGDAGALGEAIPTPLSTLWNARCAGLGSDEVRARFGLAPSKGCRMRLAVNHN